MTRLIVMLDTRSRGGFVTFVTPLPETVAPAQNPILTVPVANLRRLA